MPSNIDKIPMDVQLTLQTFESDPEQLTQKTNLSILPGEEDEQDDGCDFAPTFLGLT